MWFTIKDQTVELRIVAKPNARITALVAVNDDALQIALHAKPHKGEANKELIRFLSKLLNVPKSMIALEHGDACKYKKIVVPLNSDVQQFINQFS